MPAPRASTGCPCAEGAEPILPLQSHFGSPVVPGQRRCGPAAPLVPSLLLQISVLCCCPVSRDMCVVGIRVQHGARGMGTPTVQAGLGRAAQKGRFRADTMTEMGLQSQMVLRGKWGGSGQK